MKSISLRAEKLARLRKKMLELHASFIDLISPDSVTYESPIEEGFEYFLSKIDEEIRAEAKKGNK